MRRLSLAALAVLAACSSSSDPRPPKLAQPVDMVGLTSFLQCVPMAEPFHAGDDFEMFPGCANVWDLSGDLSLSDGGNDQWDGALELYVGDLTTTPPTHASLGTELWVEDDFPNVLSTDLSWRTPLLTAAQLDPAVVVSDGALTDAPAIAGTSAYLSPGSGTALRQVIDLTSTQGVVTLTVKDVVEVATDGFGLPDPMYRIVLRDASGAEVAELHAQNFSSAEQTRSFDLTAAAGARLTLSFEFVASPLDWTTVAAVVDDVSVKDGSGVERVVNGGFESGLTGWTTAREDQPYGLVSSAEAVGGLEVTRSFYTRPGLAWARWADEFVNGTDAPVTTYALYRSNLGSDDSGIVYPTPGTTRALSSWDGSGWDRDVALVFGDGTALYESATWMEFDCPDEQVTCGGDGDDDIYFVHPITVPAGGRVTLVHFVVQGGANTSVGATAPTARATAVDEAAAAIAKGFGSNAAFRDHMTAEQLETVANF